MLSIRFRSNNFDYLQTTAKNHKQSVPALVAALTITLQDFKEGRITQSEFLRYLESL